MADKTLRMIFNGISTLFPAPPLNGGPPPDQAFVLMAANSQPRQNQWNAAIPAHLPFIYVPRSVLADPIPAPAEIVPDDKLGPCYIYFLDNARVKLDPAPPPGVSYYSEPKLQLGERPGSNDVAPENDIRWLADLRALLPGYSDLKPSVDPRAAVVGPEVAAVVELSGGTFKASFPCKSVQPKRFQDAGGTIAPVTPHVLANEFFIDIRYPDAAAEVTLRLTPLRKGAPAAGLAGDALVLKWPSSGDLVIRIGNDTRDEAKLATSFERCNARRQPNGEPVVIPRDDDFDLHYDLLNLPPNVGHPLPQNDPHQTQFDGCKPATTG